jgi:hypothetical protein
MAEDRPFSAGEHGRHPSTRLAQPSVPDSENTSMNAVKVARANPTGHALTSDSGSFELRPRNHAVLTCRDPGNDDVRIRFGAFLTHVRE